jgi:glucose/mannose-6-phosphate isomerase
MSTDLSRLTRDAIAAVDEQDMLGDVLAQPHQIGDALWRSDAADVPVRDLPGGLVVVGMGGSAIGANLARDAIGARARKPLRVVRDYELLPGVEADSVVLAVSYSGNTEETLACFDAALSNGTPVVAVTTGGELAVRAREAGVPVIGIPSGMQPRAAVIYMTVATLEVAAACGVVDSLRGEIEGSVALLEALIEEWGPDAAESSEAKALAARLDRTVPVIYGAGPTAAVSARWKTQINENALGPAFAATLPEADHNDICGWERAASLAALAAVLLDDQD